MNPVALDGCRILVVDRELAMPEVTILAVGIGEFDGETFQIVEEDGRKYELPDAGWKIVERPLSGRWKDEYPQADWYFVQT